MKYRIIINGIKFQHEEFEGKFNYIIFKWNLLSYYEQNNYNYNEGEYFIKYMNECGKETRSDKQIKLLYNQIQELTPNKFIINNSTSKIKLTVYFY